MSDISRAAFEAFRAANGGRGRPTDWLADVSEPDWSAATGHPFTRAIGDGSVDPSAYTAYLVQDYTFIDHFTSMLGFAIGRAPSMGKRVPLGRFMGALTSDENTFFQRAFEALDVPQADRTAPDLLDVTVEFHALLRETGRNGTYAELLAVLVVTEWVYLAWARAVAADPPDAFHLREWIELHANDDFEAFVGFLRDELDREILALDDDAFRQVALLFMQAVVLERRFFAAFDES